MTNMDAALDYLKRGLSILPLAKDKKPLMQWQELQTRQPTELEVRQWFKQWPDMNIGIVTGKISNLTVIDCDSQAAIEYFHQGYQGRTPCVKTPKGMHFYFAYQEGVRNTARLTDHIDVRSEGGYVVAPPSMNGAGIAYRFINDLTNALDSFNCCFLYKQYITNQSSFNNVRQIRQDSSSMWESGKRDDSLFHTALCLVKGGMPEDEIFQVLRPVMNSWGEDDEKWINAKIRSAIDRAKRKDRNLSQEILEFINSSSGVFFSLEVENFLHCSSLADKKNVSQIFRRFAKEGVIEKSGTKNGCWRKIETDIEYINWQDADDSEYPLELPLNIHELVKLYPGNIAILAGASNTGKTSFMLETIRLNQKKYPITYLNSEMAAPELRLRLKLFDDVCKLDAWKFKAIERSSNFADVIDPDGFNVIDFMEIYDEFWKIGGWIRDVHLKLKRGVAIIAIQKKTSTKKDTQDFARGGELTLEKPRLYLAMDRGKIKIVKAKIWRSHERNPNGLTRDFNIISGWKFKPKGDWQSDEDRKTERYSDFIHED
jgi:hypothetical protein